MRIFIQPFYSIASNVWFFFTNLHFSSIIQRFCMMEIKSSSCWWIASVFASHHYCFCVVKKYVGNVYTRSIQKECKSGSNQPCGSSYASPGRCRQVPWVLVALGRICVVTAGNFPITQMSGSQLSCLKLAKARSGLVPTFHRREWLLLLDHTAVQGCWMLPNVQLVICASFRVSSLLAVQADWSLRPTQATHICSVPRDAGERGHCSPCPFKRGQRVPRCLFIAAS